MCVIYKKSLKIEDLCLTDLHDNKLGGCALFQISKCRVAISRLEVLKSMGINLKETRLEVEKVIGRGSGFVAVEIPSTPRAKRVFELSLEEARQRGHSYTGSEHLLLGLLREGEGAATSVLENLGADPSNISSQVVHMVGENRDDDRAAVGGPGSSSNKTPTFEEYGAAPESSGQLF